MEDTPKGGLGVLRKHYSNVGGTLMYFIGDAGIFELVFHVILKPGRLELFRKYQGKDCAMSVLTVRYQRKPTSHLLSNAWT